MARPTAACSTLLELLQSGGIRTMAELADRLGVDGRTVRRYVDHLIDLDVPVESVRGRYGGYRLAAGYRLPPLMLSDDEALAVLLGLVAGRRAGLTTATGTASETAAAKIRRVLPAAARPPARRRARVPRLHGRARRVRRARTPRSCSPSPTRSAITGRSRSGTPPATAGAANARCTRTGSSPTRAGGTSPAPIPEIGEDRTFRLDRIADARTLPGSFEPPAGLDPARRVLSGFATAPYRHEVTLRIQGTVEQIRTRLPASVAERARSPRRGAADPPTGRWLRVELRAERLDWLPAVLASLDLPFVIERPDELRDLVVALADRLAASARRSPPPRMTAAPEGRASDSPESPTTPTVGCQSAGSGSAL